MNRFAIFITLIFFSLTAGFYYLSHQTRPIPVSPTLVPMASPSATPTSTTIPTPRPLTFKELNALYGPCAYVPTLMYHHTESVESAKAANRAYLNVAPEIFRSQMAYLKNRGYTVVSMADLQSFFDNNTPLPKKPLLITFDDGYIDNYLHAFPILKEFGYPATIFLATGLMENPEYLNWGQIMEMSGQKIHMANHTWSHKNLQTSQSVVSKEIQTADTQLTQRGLNTPKVFAYPYGLVSATAKVELSNSSHLLAFTTRPGSTLCKKQRLELPRIRVGNSSLSVYGL